VLTEKQISLIRANWRGVIDRSEEASQLFYQLLFARNPQLKPMFERTDMVRLRQKMMATLDGVVRSIDEFEELIRELRPLGRAHAGYGVVAAHYGMVADAFLDRMQGMLGLAFTPEARKAWATALEFIAGVMLEAGAEA